MRLVQCSLQNEQSIFFQNFLCFYSNLFYVNDIFLFKLVLWNDVLLNCFSAIWYMIKSLRKRCFKSYAVFSFSFFDKWDIHPWASSRKGIFCMFSSVFCAPSHLILIPFCQFHYYFHYKTIALSNQQLVQFCKKNNLELLGLQKFPPQNKFNYLGDFFETPSINTF